MSRVDDVRYHSYHLSLWPFCVKRTGAVEWPTEEAVSVGKVLAVGAGFFSSQSLTYKLKHVCLGITFKEEAAQKWPVKSTACTSNKNKIFHRKAFCAALRLLSHLFNLYGPWGQYKSPDTLNFIRTKHGRDFLARWGKKAALILMKNSHFHRTLRF